jgi:hypothetical protein
VYVHGEYAHDSNPRAELIHSKDKIPNTS